MRIKLVILSVALMGLPFGMAMSATATESSVLFQNSTDYYTNSLGAYCKGAGVSIPMSAANSKGQLCSRSYEISKLDVGESKQVQNTKYSNNVFCIYTQNGYMTTGTVAEPAKKQYIVSVVADPKHPNIKSFISVIENPAHAKIVMCPKSSIPSSV